MGAFLTNAVFLLGANGTFSVNNILKALTKDTQGLTTGVGLVLAGVLALFGMAMIVMGVVKRQGKSMYFVTGFIALVVGAFFGSNAYNKAKDLGTGVANQVDSWGKGDSTITGD